MNTLVAFTALLLTGLVSTAPLSDEVLTVTSEFFPAAFSVYTSQHDIINLFCPLNSLNFDEDSSIDALNGTNIYIFFVEADISGDIVDYKGLYVMKNRQVTKLLDNGRDFAATNDNSRTVYLAATDGIYTFNAQENKAEKYGSVSDNLVGIAVAYNSEYLYVLTENHVVYKVTGNGTVKEELTDVKDATQIMMDYEDNLFFLDSKKRVYVRTLEGVVKKIKGLPSHVNFAQLLRPPFVLEEGVPFIGGKKVFAVYPNGTSDYENLILMDKPSAFAIEATLLQYYAYNKQIYEYNLLAIALGSVNLGQAQDFFADKTDDIQTIGATPKKTLVSSK